MEIHKLETKYADSWEYRKENLVKLSCFPIIDDLIETLPNKSKQKFPILIKVEKDSPYYDGEDLIFNPNEVVLFLKEINILRGVLNFELFLRGIDSNKFLNYCLSNKTKEELNFELSNVISFLDTAIENIYWIRITR